MRRHKNIESSYDPRFGAPEISAPNRGAYTNPHYHTQSTIAAPSHSTRTPEHLERSRARDGEHKLYKASPTFSHSTEATRSSHTQSQLNSPYTPTSISSDMSMPVHEAFIPSDRHGIRTTFTSSPSSSPPSSPPLPSASSTNGRNSLMPSKCKTYPLGLQYTMSRHQEVQPPQPYIIPTSSTVQEKPSPVESIEQWPGSM
ncbi:MAG: hypothetical protein M1818_000193 [Claussenomyces sp. TS43310]|nr:MAG: hypothetical protein M1818_000193 [Claussenomyces sp. TS43310]